MTTPNGDRFPRIDLGERAPVPPGTGPDRTYADLWSMGSDPPRFRRSWTRILAQQSPAAGAAFSHAVPGDSWERLLAVTWTLTTSATAGNRLVTASWASGDGVIFDQEPASPWLGPSSSITGFADRVPGLAVPPAPSNAVTGSATSPAAGATIATVTLPQGTYTVSWSVMLTGTVAAADLDNFGLYVGANLVATSLNGINAGTSYPQPAVVIEVPAGGAALAVKAIGAGTASSVYSATIDAPQTAGLTCWTQIPDVTMASGWEFILGVTGIQAGDQLSGITMTIERFPSDYASGTLATDDLTALEQVLRRAADWG